VTEQVIRNNIARTLNANTDVAPNLTWGIDEYFEMWGDGAFPWVDAGVLTLHANSALNEAERQALLPLVDVLNAAWTDTDGMSSDDFLRTEWPSRIAELTADAYTVMSTRGCFSETDEEPEPSGRF
jgi:hypothetical protein